MKAMTTSRTSPAKTLPNNRKEKEIILETSPISSSIPIKKLIGLERLMNFLPYLKKPIAAMPKIWIDSTVMTARAIVILRSALAERKRGTRISLP